jgi:hypothetical protein
VSRSALFLVAGAALLLGFVLLGSLSTPEPQTLPPSISTTTTTTAPLEPLLDLENFSVSQIAAGKPFTWEQTMTIEDLYPMALFENEGWVYLFATDSRPYYASSAGGLHGWRTTDGASWEPLGQLIGDITQVWPTGQGLLAVGWDQTSAGLEVWRSNDGSNWTVEELAVEDLEPFTSVQPTAAGGSNSLLVVAGNTQVSIYERLRKRLESADGFDPDRYGWSVDVVGDEVQVTLYGPLGIPFVISAKELDLSPEEIEAVVNERSEGDWASLIWTKSGDADWQQSEMPDPTSIESIYVTPEGTVVAFGYRSMGSNSWTTRDGVHWEPIAGLRQPYRADNWGGSLIGPADSGGASVLVLDDVGSWDDIGPGQLFPRAFDWYISGIGAGQGGIGAVVSGWDRDFFESPETVKPVMLTGNGITLTLDFYTGTYALETEDGTNHLWSTSGVTQEGVVPDLDTGTISFHDPETGDLLASFTIDEIVEAHDEYYSQYSGIESKSHYQAFAFTGDGAEWTIQDGGEAWEDHEVVLLEVAETHVIAVGYVYGMPYDPATPPAFGVWTAAIP